MKTLAELQRLTGKYNTTPTTEGCLEWTATKNHFGYGQLRVNYKGWLAHRFVYTNCVEPIPEGFIVMHTCDNPACINPAHLRLGTHRLNVLDKEAKGRGNAGAANGHAKLTVEDVAAIRARYAQGAISLAQLGRDFGVNRSCIHKIVNKTHWK